MPEINSLYTSNGVPVAQKLFEKVIFKNGVRISPTDLIAFEDVLIRDFDSFLFATRGRINGVYKTEYDPVKDELNPGLFVSIQRATVLNPTSNYELRIAKGKAYIGGKLLSVPLDDYISIPDNDVYPDPITFYLVLERNVRDYKPSALGEPGFAIVDGTYTSDRKEVSYNLKLVENLPQNLDSSGNLLYLQLATVFRPPILKAQAEIALNALDGVNDEGVNWAKYEANLNILTVDKVSYLTYSGDTVSKIPSTMTQSQWDALNDKTIKTSMVAGVYYVPYTKNILVITSDINLISQERIWYMPHTAGIQVTDTRYIIEDLPSVISAAFQAVADLKTHKTNYYAGYVPDGLVNEFTNGTSDTFWVLPIAEDESITLYLNSDVVDSSLYTISNVVERTYSKDGEEVTEEWGKIKFLNPPASGYRLTVDFFHDAHTLYVENTKHEAHRNDINAHSNYINNNEFSVHIKGVDNQPGDISAVVAHDNRYYTITYLDDSVNGKSDKSHNHNAVYSNVGHIHEISAVNTLQDLLTRIEDNLGVYNKTTRLIYEKVEQGVDGVNRNFQVDSLLLNDETAKLVGVRSDLTVDNIGNPVILDVLYDPQVGVVTGKPTNNTIENSNANFPIDGRLIGGHINVNVENPNEVFKIIANTATTITVDHDISGHTLIGKNYSINDFTPGGINPWTVPQKVSYGGKNLGLVVSAVQGDDEVWAVWVDTRDAGVTHSLWWATKKKDDSVWSPPVDTLFPVDSDCRPSVVKFPKGINEDLMVLFTKNHKVYYSYISYGQTFFGDPVSFYELPQDIYSPEGLYISDQGGVGDKIWMVYRRIENGKSNIYLRVFESTAPYAPEGNEILLSDGVNNCYFPTISQERVNGGKVWISWVCDNSVYDNRKKPICTILRPNKTVIVPADYIPSDISTVIDTFNIGSRLKLHHSADGLIWLVYSAIVGGGYTVYYTHLDYDVSTNKLINITPPVELNQGHEVSITERLDQTIWINYNQTTQVYSQVKMLGTGEVKWTRDTKQLVFEAAPIAGSFVELRWRLPFSSIEGRLEAVESELRTDRQKLEQIADLLNLSVDVDWSQIITALSTILSGISKYFEGECLYVDVNHWQLPAEYDNSKASDLRLYKNGSRLRQGVDWVKTSGSQLTLIQPTPENSIVIAEWNQTMNANSSSYSSDSSASSNSL